MSNTQRHHTTITNIWRQNIWVKNICLKKKVLSAGRPIVFVAQKKMFDMICEVGCLCSLHYWQSRFVPLTHAVDITKIVHMPSLYMNADNKHFQWHGRFGFFFFIIYFNCITWNSPSHPNFKCRWIYLFRFYFRILWPERCAGDIPVFDINFIPSAIQLFCFDSNLIAIDSKTVPCRLVLWVVLFIYCMNRNKFDVLRERTDWSQ